jgi:hypothetical protein
VPESKKRKKADYTPPSVADKKPVRIGSPRWLPIVMVGLWVIGLAWIVAWYMVPNSFMQTLGAWNIAIGFSCIAGGFLLATRWR